MPSTMTPADLRALIDELLDLLRTHGDGGEPADPLRLPPLLDRLALAATTLDPPFDSREHPDPPTASYDTWRGRVVRAFPGLGPYNAVQPVTEVVGAGQAVVGDAVDDLADIARDLEEVALRWQASPDDALWHFDLLFRTHWGQHLRQLQLVLHREPSGW